jgi:hypothetical protein
MIKGKGEGFSGVAGAPSDVAMPFIVAIRAGSGGDHTAGTPANAHHDA